jgi:uncharacterized membrane protein YebE (DUF533 family)
MGDPVTTTLFVFAAASSAVAAYGSYQSGKAQQYEYQRQAEQEKLSARDREIERRNRLLKALSQRTVAAASSGAALEGTPSALINRDFREYSLESLSAQASSASTQAGLRAAGTNAKRIGTINAVSNIIDFASSVTQIRMNKPKPTGGGGYGRSVA